MDAQRVEPRLGCRAALEKSEGQQRVGFDRPSVCELCLLRSTELADYGTVERVALVSPMHDENAAYLKAKQVIMGHMLGLTALRTSSPCDSFRSTLAAASCFATVVIA